ncbi:type II toxin-antitoxin system Phd/YefM family antitoxin [Marinicella pacifica]|nr:type II toxin-antitoxin system prevent-host-death family antitoxin [Marinicella pacifica]
MDSINYSSFRKSMAEYLDRVNEDSSPVLITRQKGASAVLIGLDDFHAMQETIYLMASPKNAQNLNESIAEIESGKVVDIDLNDLDS